MLERAKAKLPWLRVLVGEITELPFVDDSFDLATAAFVLSHVCEYPDALKEILRVLKPSGLFAASAWAPAIDPYTSTWSDVLADLISKAEVDRALAEVAPLEEYFSTQGNLERALIHAGFSEVGTHSVELEFTLTVDQFFEDREISSGGRLGSHILGPIGWANFRRTATQVFQTRFGPVLQCHRRALIVVGKRVLA
jgi:SAM-dependent methyltransferase